MIHKVIKLSQQHFGEILDFKGVVRSSKGHVYYCQKIVYSLGKQVDFCTCVGWRTRFAKNRETSKLYGTCSHFEVFEDHILKNFNEDDIIMSKYIVDANIKALNDVWGGLPLGIGINFFGEPKSSKTTTGAWLGFGRMKESGENLLFIDAEKGFANHVLPNLLRLYNKNNDTDFGIIHKKLDFKKWKRSPSTIMPYKDKEVVEDLRGKKINVHVISIANIKEMLTFVGTPMELVVAKKIALHPENWLVFDNGDVDESPIGRYVDDPNGTDEFCGFVFDSLTFLIKFFGSEQQSFPSRDTAQGLIISQLGELLFNNDHMFGITITHGSISPTDVATNSKPVGGKAVGHGFKYQLRLSIDKKLSKDLNTIITIDSYRIPSGKGGTGKKIAISDKGVF